MYGKKCFLPYLEEFFMVDQDLIQEKIANIQSCLKRIQDKTQGKTQSLQDLDTQDIFVLNLQRAMQSTIDLASHVVADENLGLPKTLRENFELLEKNKIIDAKLAEEMKKMVSFRNIAVHDYQSIDPEILKAILAKHLKGLERFYQVVYQHFHKTSS